jgi:hypothetical protein
MVAPVLTALTLSACSSAAPAGADSAPSDLTQRVPPGIGAGAPISPSLANKIASRLDVPTPIHFYEQQPLATLGQAVSIATDGANSAAGKPLPATCVGGNAVRTPTPGGSGVIGGDGLLAEAPSDDAFLVQGKSFRLTPTSPFLQLEQVTEYQAAVKSSPTRVSGYTERYDERSAFHFDYANEHRTSSGSECGDAFVRDVVAARFLSYAFVIDFEKAEDRAAYPAPSLAGANALFRPTAELSKFLIDRSAKVSVHVLVSSALADYVKYRLSNENCDAVHLTGCEALRARLVELHNEMSVLPGGDDSLDSIQVPGSPWGVYDVTLSDYRIFP